MPSMQLRASRHAVHTVGIADSGVLYIDIQCFRKHPDSRALTYYVRPADVARIKKFASAGRSEDMTDFALVRLMAASFHSAQYALEWLHWARVTTVCSRDEAACHNAEEQIPIEMMCA